MRRRYVLSALAVVALAALAVPAFGAPSPLNTSKRALKVAKKANKKAGTAIKRSRTALRRANAATTAAQGAANSADQALGIINAPGGVPRAGTAASADKATSADNATNAETAAQLAGLKRTGKLVRVTATSGPDAATARAAAPEQALGSSGPFTIYGKCFTDESVPQTVGEVYARTSESGALLDGQTDNLDGDPAFLDTDTAETDREIDQVTVNNDSVTIEFDDDNSTLVAPDLDVVGVRAFLAAKRGALPGGNGLYGDGDVCLLGAQVFDD